MPGTGFRFCSPCEGSLADRSSPPRAFGPPLSSSSAYPRVCRAPAASSGCFPACFSWSFSLFFLSTCLKNLFSARNAACRFCSVPSCQKSTPPLATTLHGAVSTSPSSRNFSLTSSLSSSNSWHLSPACSIVPFLALQWLHRLRSSLTCAHLPVSISTATPPVLAFSTNSTSCVVKLFRAASQSLRHGCLSSSCPFFRPSFLRTCCLSTSFFTICASSGRICFQLVSWLTNFSAKLLPPNSSISSKIRPPQSNSFFSC